MRWATRAGVHIDRAACAWLIRRFIDPHAEFSFVTDPTLVPADATGFDMPGVDLSHHTGPAPPRLPSAARIPTRTSLNQPTTHRNHGYIVR